MPRIRFTAQRNDSQIQEELQKLTPDQQILSRLTQSTPQNIVSNVLLFEKISEQVKEALGKVGNRVKMICSGIIAKLIFKNEKWECEGQSLITSLQNISALIFSEEFHFQFIKSVLLNNADSTILIDIFGRVLNSIQKNGFRANENTRQVLTLVVDHLNRQIDYLNGRLSEEQNSILSKRMVFGCQDDRLATELKYISYLFRFESLRRKMNDMQEEEESQLIKIDKFLPLLQKQKFKDLILLLLRIKCERTKKIVGEISTSSLVQENGVVRLKIQGLQFPSEFLNQQILSQAIYSSSLRHEHYFYTKNNYLVTNSALYLKYDILDINKLCLRHYLYPLMKITDNAELKKIKQAEISEQIVQLFVAATEAVCQKKTISVYRQGNQFAELSSKDIEVLFKQLSKMALGLLTEAQEQQSLNITAALFRLPQSFSALVKSLGYVKQLENPCIILQNLLSIMELIIFEQTVDENLLNNAEFMIHLGDLMKRIQSPDGQYTCLIDFVDKKLQKLVQFGFDTTNIPFQNIYLCRIKQFFKVNDSFQLNGRFISETFGRYISKYPQSNNAFQRYLKQQISEQLLSQQNIGIWQEKSEKRMNQLFLLHKIIKFYSLYNFVTDQQLDELMMKMIQKYSFVIAELSLAEQSTAKLEKQGKSKIVELVKEVKQLFNNNNIAHIQTADFCLKQATQDKYLNVLVSKCSQLKIWLQLSKQKYINKELTADLLTITVEMDVFMSDLYNRIISFQFRLGKEELSLHLKISQQIEKKNSEILFKKVHSFLMSLSSSIRVNVFAGYDVRSQIQLISIFLIFFDKFKQVANRRLIHAMLVNFEAMSRTINNKMVFSVTFYYYSQQYLLPILQSLFRAYNPPLELTQAKQILSLGSNMVKFIQKQVESNKDPEKQFNQVIDSIIHRELKRILFNIFSFVTVNQTVIVNGLQYHGRKNIQTIKSSLQIDTLRRCLERINKDNINFYYMLLNKELTGDFMKLEKRSVRERRQIPSDLLGDQKISQIQNIPSGNVIPIVEKDYRRNKNQLLRDISRTVFAIKQSRQSQQSLQKFYVYLLRKILDKKMASGQIIGSIEVVMEGFVGAIDNQTLSPQQSKKTCIWLKYLFKQSLCDQAFKLSEYITPRFIERYIHFLKDKSQDSAQFREMLGSSLIILQKMIPHRFPHQLQSNFGTIMGEICNLILLSLPHVKLTQNEEIIEALVTKLTKNYRPQFDRVVIELVKLLTSGHNYSKIVAVIDQLVENQMIGLMEMQADVKAYFLKISEEVSDKSTPFYTSTLKDFIDYFKIKYKEDILGFRNLTSKFLQKTVTKKQDSKEEQILLAFDSRQSFGQSQMGKKTFASYQPSDIIKDIINTVLNSEAKEESHFVNKLSSFQQIFYYHPFLLPHILFRPVNDSKGSLVAFIDLLLEKTQTLNAKIWEFMFYACLDHSLVLTKGKDNILFSEYLCYRILKKISEEELSCNRLLFILNMVQLKRFNYLSKFNLNPSTSSLKARLQGIFVQRIAEDQKSQAFHSITIITEILQYIYRYDEIDNLKFGYVVNKGRKYQRNFVNECLIPFRAIIFPEFLGKRAGRRNREDIIRALETANFPVLWQQNQLVKLDSKYQGFLSLQRFDGKINKAKLNLDSRQLDVESFNYSALLDEKPLLIRKSKNISQVLLNTSKNNQFQKRVSAIKKHFLPRQPALGIQDQFPRGNIFERQQLRLLERQQIRLEQRQAQQMRRRGGGRRRHRVSNYAPEDIGEADYRAQYQKEKEIQSKFVQSMKSISHIPSKSIESEANPERNEQTPQFDSSSNLLIEGEEEINQKISQINSLHQKTSQPKMEKEELRGMRYTEMVEYLNNKLANAEYEYYEKILDEQSLAIYFWNHPQKLQYLDDKRSNMVDYYAQLQLSKALVRRDSNGGSMYSANTDQIIDALDDNYIYITRGLARIDSLISEESFELQLNGFSMVSKDKLSSDVFAEVDEDLVIKFIARMYLNYPEVSCNIISVLLQNKKIQVQLLNTLLHLLRSPFESNWLPKVVKRWKLSSRQWIVQEKEIQQQYIRTQILKAIYQAKCYCFYSNEEFLNQSIGCSGFKDIQIAPKAQYQSYYEKDSYKPFVQILEYAIEYHHNLAALLIKGVGDLPLPTMKKVLKLFKRPEIKPKSREHQNAHSIFQQGHGQRKIICEKLFQNMSELYKNTSFQSLYFKQFPLHQKYPAYNVLSILINYNLYERPFLKFLHVKLLKQFKNGPQGQAIFDFFNRIFSIYTNQQLLANTELENYQDIYCTVFKYLIRRRKNIDQEPIKTIVGIPKYMSLESKQLLLQFRINSQHNAEDQYRNYADNTDQIYSKRGVGIFQSAFQELRNKSDEFWQKTFRVTFINTAGQNEDGIGEGVVRQWFTLMTTEMVKLNFGFFTENSQRYYFFNQLSGLNPRHLQYFQFIGKLFAKCALTQKFFICPSFNILLYKYLIDPTSITLKDLAIQIDESLQFTENTLAMIKNMTTEKQLQAMDMRFIIERKREVTSVDRLNMVNQNGVLKFKSKGNGEDDNKNIQILNRNIYISNKQDENNKPSYRKEYYLLEMIELVQNGRNISLNLQNKSQYLRLYRQKLIQSYLDPIKPQIQAFKEGFSKIVPVKYLSILTPFDLRLLAEGSEVDVEDFQKYTKISGYQKDDEIIRWFWEIVLGFSHQEIGQLLHFWTGTPKVHSEGFKKADLTIQRIPMTGWDTHPVGHTCSRVLDIPPYEKKQILSEKLLYGLHLNRLGLLGVSDNLGHH